MMRSFILCGISFALLASCSGIPTDPGNQVIQIPSPMLPAVNYRRNLVARNGGTNWRREEVVE